MHIIINTTYNPWIFLTFTNNLRYAREFVLGMQEQDSKGHPRMIALLKHFTAYSTETNRGHDTYNISEFDLYDTYLPQVNNLHDSHATSKLKFT